MPMFDHNSPNPFHNGELEAQTRAGVGDVAQWAGDFIRDYLPEQHREFHSALPFLVVSGSDSGGRVWATLLEGEEGFVTSPDPKQLTVATTLPETDPLAASFARGTHIGVLGIELETRRRNRFSGHVRLDDEGYRIDVTQSFGNCPQYINQRTWHRAERAVEPVSKETKELAKSHIGLIERSDTMFIGSGQFEGQQSSSQGYDASHRGGSPGFVGIVDSTHLRIPDYAGNNFFNTIGNLLTDSRIGLLFVDFQTGGLLHITGTATVDWRPKQSSDSEVLRSINVTIESVLERPQAVSLRWSNHDKLQTPLKLVRREVESIDITSFYFATDNKTALKPFEPGQHLPIELQIPDQPAQSSRSYSLSGSPMDREHYRLSVKRDPKGMVSRYLHDELALGSVVSAQAPSGHFVIPCEDCPLVLVSAGVGLTPMLSILHRTAGQKRPVWFVHSTRNGNHHALRAEVEQLADTAQNVQKTIFYSQPEPNDLPGQDYDESGRMTTSQLLELKAGQDAHYLLCGPAAFVANLRAGLEASGVPAAKIHLETFGAVAG